MKERFKIVSAVFLIFIKEDKILLLRRFNTGHKDGEYSLVAGHLDGDESVTSAAIREAAEEVGVKIKSEDLKFVHITHRKKNENDHERLDFYFQVLNWEGEPRIMEPDKCDDLEWFSLNKLPPNIVDYVAEAIRNFCQNNPYSEYGWSE